MNKIIVISGATATGKTGLSLKIAQEFGLEIINFDSLLFYQELNIGTAKPRNCERNNIKHHLIDIESITNPINAADFSKKALKLINEMHQIKQVPILVGGSGFYLKALLNGMYDSVTTDSSTLKKSEELYNKEDIFPFLEILKEHDKNSFNLYHQNDHYRIRRAVEHFWMTGIPFSAARKKMDQQIANAPKNNWNIKHIYLEVIKDQHWKIIKQRTMEMIESGLVDEVQNLLRSGFNKDLKPLQSIGYKQTIDYLSSELQDQEQLIENIYIATRRLAKSQKTWFNKVQNKDCFQYPYNVDAILKQVREFIHE